MNNEGKYLDIRNWTFDIHYSEVPSFLFILNGAALAGPIVAPMKLKIFLAMLIAGQAVRS